MYNIKFQMKTASSIYHSHPAFVLRKWQNHEKNSESNREIYEHKLEVFTTTERRSVT
jgi:hypothetical protein